MPKGSFSVHFDLADAAAAATMIFILSVPVAGRSIQKFQSTEKCSGMSVVVGVGGIYLDAYP